jgi:hypothetical protein
MKRLVASGVFVLIGLALPTIANAQKPDFDCPGILADAIPARSQDAVSGSAFARRVEALSGTERDAVLEPILVAGDIPQFLRRLKPVVLRAPAPGGSMIKVTVCVMPDYLAIGSDDDFVRVPMGLRTAMAVASHFGFVLPTTKIVDAIYAGADIRIAPEPLPAGPQMRSTDYFVMHDRLIRQESLLEGLMPGMLLAGQKKDLVITNRLRANPGRVAIYGWHLEDGKPIQPLSTFHGENYADYSHGVRLVSAVAYVGSERRSLLDILQDARLANIVSSEGPIPNLGALISSLSHTDTNEVTIQPAGNRGDDVPRTRSAVAR